MSNLGFYHPSRGYWEAFGAMTVEELLLTYPQGTVNIPLKPGEDFEWSGSQWVAVAPPTIVPTIDDVARERERRLAFGFHYNFNDARGIHLIGTTDADMKGWREVTDAAQAEINLGNPNGPFTTIVTNTGPATITAMEWQAILRAAKVARDPFWQASFALEAMNPIPSDYAADSRWPAQP